MDIVTCPSTGQLVQLLRGQIIGQDAAEMTKHIAGCSRCLQSVELLGENKSGLSLTGTKPESEVNQLAFLSPATSADELGWLGQYRVLKLLGEGGMGIVLAAEDTHLQRNVALKVIKAEYNKDQETRQRFLREARMMAQVKSDHVVTIHHVGTERDTCYIAMELLEGQSLDSLLLEVARVPIHQTLRIGREIATALHSAHSKGLIHRDIKPENVWLEVPNARVKLLDFGLARPRTMNTRLTSTGVIMGTPAFMSPEQALAEEVDERADLFSLGSLLYLLASGRQAFHGDSITAILVALIEQIPKPPSQYHPSIPKALDDLILHLLEKRAADRPQTAKEVIERIEAIEAGIVSMSTSAGTMASAERTVSQFSTTGISVGPPGLGTRVREAERRQVSVLICSCNLFESDDYLTHLDIEDQSELLHNFQQICTQAVLKVEGTIVECTDERVFACFGYPVAHEDAASRAATAGLAIIKELNSLAENIRKECKVDLGPWVGLHTGLALVETKGENISVVGEAKNVAIHLKDTAIPGQVICTEPTNRLLRRHFHSNSLGAHKIKSLAQPVNLYGVKALLEGVDHQEDAAPVELTPLTGRDNEMSLLKDRWEQVQEGMGQVVLLTGDPGLGKSRLVQTMKQHVLESTPKPIKVASKNAPVLEWHCSPQFANSVLYPAITFFKNIFELTQSQEPSAQLDLLIQNLEPYDLAQPDIVPIFQSLLSLGKDERYSSLGLTPVREREEVLRVIKEWLRAYSSKQPILFIVEDLQWADATTIEFLGQVLAESDHDQMLTMLTFRTEFRAPWPALPHQTSLTLNRLTKRQATDLMRNITGNEDLPEAIIDKVHERAGGVPLFIEEFTKMVQESGAMNRLNESGTKFRTLMEREIPATLQDLIMSRLDRMDGNPEVAQLAATIGREFNHELITATSSLDAATLQGELTKLVAAEILYERGRPPKSTYTFKHALLQDALYNAMVKTKRQQFHRRIAEILESKFQQTGETQPEILAHHFSEAGLHERSVDYWFKAGLRCIDEFANLEAISHLARGLEALKMLPESPERDVTELALLNPLGSAYQAALGYAAPQVGTIYSRASELCHRIGETPQLFAVMWGNWTWHLVRAELKLCLELAYEMVALARYAGDKGISMEACVAPAVTLYYWGDFAGCRKYCEEAISQYEDSEQCRIWARTLGQNSSVVVRCYLALALWHLGYPDEAVRVNDEMLKLAHQINHPFSLAHGLHFTGWLYKACRLPDKLLAAAKEQRVVSIQQGFSMWNATANFLDGSGLLLQGKLEEALPAIERGLLSFQAVAAALTVPAMMSSLAEVYMKLGRYSEATRALQEGIILADRHDDRSYEAELKRLKGDLTLLELNDEVAAETAYRDAIATAQKQQCKSWELVATCSLAKLLQKQGKKEEARTTLATICGAFIEGSNMPDLIESKAFLATL